MRSGLQTFLPLILSLVSLVVSWSGYSGYAGYGGWRSWSGSGKNTLENQNENPTIIYADLPMVNHNPGQNPNPRDAAPSSFETGSSSRFTQVHAFFTQRLDGTTQLLPQFSTEPPKNTDIGTDTDKSRSTWQQVCQTVIDLCAYLSSYPSPSPVESTDKKDRPLKNLPVSSSSDNTVLPGDSHDAAAAGNIPEHAKGSCMAVVVSLVVGIMWF